jgi:hypothetical protein
MNQIPLAGHAQNDGLSIFNKEIDAKKRLLPNFAFQPFYLTR